MGRLPSRDLQTWEPIHFLDRVQERAPEIAAEIVEGLVSRTRARRGAMVLTDSSGDSRVIAAWERTADPGGRVLDPSRLELPEPLDALRPGDGAVVSLESGHAAAIPLRAVVREAPPHRDSRRRFDSPRIERTLGFVYLEGEDLKTGGVEREIRVASTLGSLLLAQTPWIEESGRDTSTGTRSPLLLRGTLEEEIRMARETDTPFALGLVRTDAVRRMNAETAPRAVRMRLAELGEALRDSLRRSDLVVRCGGGSFALLLPATDRSGAASVSAKVRDLLSSRGEEAATVACASFPDDAGSADSLLAVTETALREASLSEGGACLTSAVTVGDHEDLDRLLETMEALEALAMVDHGNEGQALLRAVVSAARAARGILVQVEDLDRRVFAALGEPWEPSEELLDAALADPLGVVLHPEEKESLPGVVAIRAEDRSGARWVALLEAPAGGFPSSSLSAAETILRLGGPLLRDEPVTAGEPVAGIHFGSLVGDSPAMQHVYERMRKVLTAKVTVLIVGETGTGKELIARAIHDHSDRAGGPFITVDCGALPPTLADSELFGHVKGAFTDAATDKEGLIERAAGGTLLLDEVTSMSTEIQARLLRFLQEGEVRRVGGRDYRKVDVRVIAASNHDPRREVESGSLRLDLYHRLQGMEIHVPPLRERREDIPALASRFLRSFVLEERGELKRLSANALAVLLSHDWRGNVRELENAIRAGALVSESDTIEAHDLPKQLRDAETQATWTTPQNNEEFKDAKDKAIAEISRRFLRAALANAHGNVSIAARDTGLQRTYLHRLMKQYGVDPGEFKVR